MNIHKKKRSIPKRWLWIIGVGLLCIGLWNLFTNLHLEKEKELRQQFRERVIENFPAHASQFTETMGLFPYESDSPVNKEVHSTGKTVVLVHGLDDPGKVWQNLAPALAKSGFDEMPDDRQKEIHAFAAYLTSMTHGLGDGLVTVESTHLQGIPHQIVSGTHLSMIRNITQKSSRIPPAVPIILHRLKKEV